MKTKLVITDLTRMYQGRVCIAGYDEGGKCIRPVTPWIGIPESSLLFDGHPIIFPFAKVEIELLQALPRPPHIEDFNFTPELTRFIQRIEDREPILIQSLFASVADIFEQPIQTGPGFYVADCQGARSLGTIEPQNICDVIYAPDENNAWDYRMEFIDNQNERYRLKITDLTWHYFCDSLRSPKSQPPQIAAILTNALQSSKVYLRIGLARGWKKYPDRCYLQVTGIYTFPDYLNGKNFNDFIR